MFIGTLCTDIVEKHEFGLLAEGGQFTIKVAVENDYIEKSGSPKTYVLREIAIHLAQAIQDTGVPREFWYFESSLEAQKEFELPLKTRMSV